MWRPLILILALLVATNCSSHRVSQTNSAVVSQNAATPQVKAPSLASGHSEISGGSHTKKDIPAAFTAIDFKNHSYPGRQRIGLSNGSDEHAFQNSGGGVTFDFKDVYYVDLTGDGKEEAIVRLSRVECGGSCDGGSDLFYFLSAKNNKLIFLSRIETGSIGYGCGLKSFVLHERTLVLEAFRKCTFDGISLNSAYDADVKGGKFTANEFTRFTFRFNGRTFVQRKRELLPNTASDVKNYPVEISIVND